MRIGSNPERDKEIHDDAYHRIIIPVFVPKLEGYYEKGLEFTQLCLGSVIKTKHPRSRLTVVNNGSCPEVTQYLQDLFSVGDIDQLVHHAKNVGKIDAVIPIAKTVLEKLITISDGDVLFKDGWIQGVEEVFTIFPEAGMVSPVPNGTLHTQHTKNTLFDAFFKRKLKIQSICDPKAMLRFAESIGNDNMYKNEIKLQYQLTVMHNGFSAVVGCGHFVSTLRREVFNFAPSTLSRLAYAPQADKEYIDVPNEKAGFWRLATVENYAYHIGNFPQEWMVEEFENLTGNRVETFTIPKSKKWNIHLAVKKFVNRLWANKFVRPYFFKRLGLKEGFKDF
jgi:glycosyl transferase family 2